MNENAAFYKAFVSRDARFDGVFYIGVTSTGIYCRPVCTAKIPKEKNCRFFTSAAAAEKESFRPCLRCCPELAPGHAPLDNSRRIAGLFAGRVEEGLLDDGANLEEVAAQFKLSSRQVRRILQKELGVSPIEFAQTRRLLLAKQLLTETVLPVTEIAFASGFSSLRRFNDLFSGRYRMPPTSLRREAANPKSEKISNHAISLQLHYRPPYDWHGMIQFLSARTLKGVEQVSGDSYARTVRLGTRKGWVRVRHLPKKNALLAEISHSLHPVLPALLARLRNLFDLNARPDLISQQLKKDPALKSAAAKNPGLRVPGAFDGFELAARAVLGQQITVKAATTLAGRFAEAFGVPVETPFDSAKFLCPSPERIAVLKPERLAELGIIRTRAASIIHLAREIVSGRLRLEAGARPEEMIPQLCTLPGIGEWTANYIAMRALRWPDAFPKEDIALRKNLGGVTARQAEAMSQAWRPWRSYATLHLWRNPVQTKEAL